AGDVACLRRCFHDAARALLAIGARRVFLPMLQPPRIERPDDLHGIETLNLFYDRLLLYSDHTTGGNGMDSVQGRGTTNGDGLLSGRRNVFVADSSLFPTACGVGPSWTIMALSHLLTSRLAAA